MNLKHQILAIETQKTTINYLIQRSLCPYVMPSLQIDFIKIYFPKVKLGDYIALVEVTELEDYYMLVELFKKSLKEDFPRLRINEFTGYGRKTIFLLDDLGINFNS